MLLWCHKRLRFMVHFTRACKTLLSENNKTRLTFEKQQEKNKNIICRPWSVRIEKNCALGLEHGPRPAASGRTQDLWHSFSQYGPPGRQIIYIYFFLKHFSGPESGILEFDWLLTRVPPVQFFPIRTGFVKFFTLVTDAIKVPNWKQYLHKNGLRVVSNFGDGDCGAGEIHTRARKFEETRREGSAENWRLQTKPGILTFHGRVILGCKFHIVLSSNRCS